MSSPDLSAPFFLISADDSMIDSYDSIEEAILNTEAIDIIDQEYCLFDAAGKQIHLIAVGREGPLRSWQGIWTPDASVEIDHVSDTVNDRLLFDGLISKHISSRPDVKLADDFDGRVRQAAYFFRQN